MRENRALLKLIFIKNWDTLGMQKLKVESQVVLLPLELPLWIYKFTNLHLQIWERIYDEYMMKYWPPTYERPLMGHLKKVFGSQLVAIFCHQLSQKKQRGNME